MCPPEFIDTITQAHGQPHNSWSPKLVRNLNIARDYLHQHQHALRRLHCAFKKNRSNQNQHCPSQSTPRVGELVTNLNTTSAFLPITSSLPPPLGLECDKEQGFCTQKFTPQLLIFKRKILSLWKRKQNYMTFILITIKDKQWCFLNG